MQALQSADMRTQFIECAEWTQSLSERLFALVDWSIPDQGMPRLSERLNRLYALPESLQRKVRIAIVGENKSGKSSIVNALIESDLAPTDSLEFTFTPMIFRYGAQPSAHVEYQNGQTQIVAVQRLETELRNLHANHQGSDVVRVVVEMPIELLKVFELADVPGLGAAEDNARIARAFTEEKVDAVLFVLNASLIGQSSMAQEIRALTQEFPEVALILNKMDVHGFENAERMLEYVREQDFGRSLPIFPMCTTQINISESPLPVQWFRALREEFIDRVSADARRVQTLTAINKCQRDLVVVDTLFQATWHQASRAKDLIEKTIVQLQDAENETMSRMETRLQGWLDQQAFARATQNLCEQFKQVKAPTRQTLETMVRDAFSEPVVDQESEAFYQEIQDARAEAWQITAAKIEQQERGYSAFQLETTLKQMRKVDHDQPIAIADHDGAMKDASTSTSKIITTDESRRSGLMSHEDIVEAGAAGLIVGGVITGIITNASSAILLSTVTGVGLPIAAVVAVLWGMGRWLDRSRNKTEESSVVELNQAAEEIRKKVATKLCEAYFPKGIRHAVAQQIATDRAEREAALQSQLWNSENRESDLLELSQAALAVERLTRDINALRREFVQDECEDSFDSTRPKTKGAVHASLLLNPSKHYPPTAVAEFRNEIGSLLSMEDVQLQVVDRGLTGEQLEWLRDVLPPQVFLRALVYDVERDTATRAEFVRSVQRIRNNQRGEVSVRAVKFNGEDRTPLDRIFLFGNEWAVELNLSLSLLGEREIVVTLLDSSAETLARQKYLEGFASFQAVEDTIHGQTFDILDF